MITLNDIHVRKLEYISKMVHNKHVHNWAQPIVKHSDIVRKDIQSFRKFASHKPESKCGIYCTQYADELQSRLDSILKG